MNEKTESTAQESEESTNELTDEQLAGVSGGWGGMLSNVSKTRSEISMTFARNARA